MWVGTAKEVGPAVPTKNARNPLGFTKLGTPSPTTTIPAPAAATLRG